jgi:hypothetical protein
MIIATGRWPWYGWLGIAVVVVFWLVNWYAPGLRTHWAFFFLWLGYILTMDAIAVRIGRPPLVTDPRQLIWMFVLSAPVWWIFEVLNERTQYWRYTPAGAFTGIEFFMWSTLNFSTVIPAVFTTANAMMGLRVFRRHLIHIRTGTKASSRRNYFIIGCAMLLACLIWPRYGMALLWMSLFFILDPINFVLGRESLLRKTAGGDWRTVVVYCGAALICGFFWELWNLYSWPKWIYDIPYVDVIHIFEMPLAGYLGYLPFGLELYAMTALVAPLLRIRIPSFEKIAG